MKIEDFGCAGVTRPVQNRHWTWYECLSISVSSRSSSASEALELQRLQEEHQTRRERFLQEKALKKKQLEQEGQKILEQNVPQANLSGQTTAPTLRNVWYSELMNYSRTNLEDMSEIAAHGPTFAQIAARRVMSRDLPANFY